ncbi:MAG: PKD domain-containing protein [Desulfococcaceae bacterium]
MDSDGSVGRAVVACVRGCFDAGVVRTFDHRVFHFESREPAELSLPFSISVTPAAGDRAPGRSAATLGGRLYAVETGAAGLDDDSPWPKFGHDIRQTGRNSENQGPTAEAGPDQTVLDGESVLLDGAGSSDPDYGISDYQWRQTRGAAVEFTEAGRAEARFVAPGDQDDATLVFELTVTDIGGLRATDTVSIAVEENDAFCFLTAVQTEWQAGKIMPATLAIFLATAGGAWIRRRAK